MLTITNISYTHSKAHCLKTAQRRRQRDRDFKSDFNTT